MRGTSSFVSRSVVGIVFVCVVVASGACSKKTVTLNDGKSPMCTTFNGGELTASWSDCPDKSRREVKCAMFVDKLKCDCLVDGAQTTFFFGDHPVLSTRADATRVANANCRWSLESP